MINLYDKVMISKSVEAKCVCAGMIGVVAFLHNNGDITVEFGNGKGKITAMITAPANDFSRLNQNSTVQWITGTVYAPEAVSIGTVGRRFVTSSGSSKVLVLTA